MALRWKKGLGIHEYVRITRLFACCWAMMCGMWRPLRWSWKKLEEILYVCYILSTICNKYVTGPCLKWSPTSLGHAYVSKRERAEVVSKWAGSCRSLSIFWSCEVADAIMIDDKFWILLSHAARQLVLRDAAYGIVPYRSPHRRPHQCVSPFLLILRTLSLPMCS
jgi:hypothetical protein